MDELRLNRVRNNMEEEGLEQILVTSTASVYYLTGQWVEPHERMIAVYVTMDECVVFGNEIFGLPAIEGAELILHTDSDSPVQALSRRVRPGRIGIDKGWASRFLIPLMEFRPDLHPVLGSAPVDHARMIKDEAEQQALRRASAINDLVVEGAISALHDGVKEQELASLVNQLFLEHGADGEGVQLVCFGANAADPHHAAGPSMIQRGDCAVFDIFTPIGRYWCDMTRTVFFEEAGEEQRRVYDLVRRANQAAIERIRPGVLLCDIDQTARNIIAEGGYGPYFTHRLGHGIGLDCHEPADVSSASAIPAQPGMVFSVEPGIYLPGRFGVRIEDLVLVTEQGCEVLNHAGKDLRIV